MLKALAADAVGVRGSVAFPRAAIRTWLRELSEEAPAPPLKGRVAVLAMRNPTWIEWAVYTFVARGCRKVAGQALDSGERIRLETLSFDRLVEHMAEDAEAGKYQRLAIRAQYDPAKREELKRIIFG